MEWVVKATPRQLFLRERYQIPIVQEAGGGEQLRSGQVRKTSSPSPGFDHQAVQLAASRYTDYSIQAITLPLWNTKTKPV